jgi:hypothetical protein
MDLLSSMYVLLILRHVELGNTILVVFFFTRDQLNFNSLLPFKSKCDSGEL